MLHLVLSKEILTNSKHGTVQFHFEVQWPFLTIFFKTYSDPITLSVHTKCGSTDTHKGPDEQSGELQDVKVNFSQFNIKPKECERSVMTHNLNVNKNSKKGIFCPF